MGITFQHTDDGLVADTKKQYDAWKMLTTFSVENVGTALSLGLYGRISGPASRSTGGMVNKGAKPPIVGQVIKGFKEHGIDQAVARGFEYQDILKIVREGKAVDAIGRYGPQTRYTLGGNTVIINSQGEVVTVFSHLPTGNFIPWR